MPIRSLVLPKDLAPVAEAAVEAFQYPEHPEWGVKADEQEEMLRLLRQLRRLWPLVRALQAASPSLRDILRGVVWEEDGAIRGMSLALREGTADVWTIGTVGVVPSHRRRGIARALVLETLHIVRARGGARATLAVIEENEPARSLYHSLGFVDFDGYATYSLSPSDPIEPTALPSSYEERPLPEFDWRTRYELDRRIVPDAAQRFAPVTPGRYRPPWLLPALAPLFKLAQGTRKRDLTIRRQCDGQVVACAGWTLRTRGRGVNRIRIRLDPDYPALAPYLVRRLAHELVLRSPTLRVELVVPTWLPAVARAAEEVGFVRRTSNREMGIELAGGRGAPLPE